VLYEEYKITKKIRLIELFAGVGAQAMALERLGADFEHYRVVEFDKYAIASYNAIHGTDFPTMDITQIKGEDLGIVDTDSFTYLLTYSFPCTDLSVAGKQMGMQKGSGTRSGLLWEVERLLNETENLPQVLIMENVTQVHGTKNKDDFQNWVSFLESKGYSNFWQDLNAKNYGVAQNRDRCFMVSLLGNYTYKFPEPIPLRRAMKDYLEDNVDEKYYIKSEKADKLIAQLVENGTLPKEKPVDVAYRDLFDTAEQYAEFVEGGRHGRKEIG
jgi:DNA (cytosine-5)-methyltransferase 1